jgi:hypothetical protein
MTEEHLALLLKTAEAKKDAEGWVTMPESRSLTLYVAHNGASLSVTRVEALRTENGFLQARTAKGEIYLLTVDDVYAGSIDGNKNTARKAGFV